METIFLRNPQILPAEEVIENALGDSYSAYEDLMKTITDTRWGLVPKWNYYKDGKAWLCKVSYKKKTVFWLSIWDKFFKTTFYFTEKTGSGITGLDIKLSIKESFSSNKPIGKLIPLTIGIKNKDQIKDVLAIVEYKKSLK